MQISVELTLSPLQDDFDGPISAFIKRLRDSKFTVQENPLSTQVYGEYGELMPFLTAEIEKTFAETDHALVYMKLVNSNRSDYKPDF